MSTSETKSYDASKGHVRHWPVNGVCTVAKELKFEAAHRLIQGYPGNCANNHGHSWIAIVKVGLKDSSGGGLNTYGFIKDYGDFKPLKAWVDSNWDHATLVSADDTAFIAWLQENNQRHYVVPHNPSSEVLSGLLYKKAQELLSDSRCQVIEVRIQETCTSEASYTEIPAHKI